ncbi:hypothetical protein ACVWWG_004515 [Bradyrhizobium sp. LB7.2]
MPAATRAGTIEGVAPGLKQLLASLSQTAHVVISSCSGAKDFLKTKPSAEETFRGRSSRVSSFAK